MVGFRLHFWHARGLKTDCYRQRGLDGIALSVSRTVGMPDPEPTASDVLPYARNQA